MTLSERIYQDYVTAMKARDKPRVEFLSYVRAQIKYAALDARKESLEDAQTEAVLLKQRKSLQETLASVESAGDTERTAKAKAEIEIIAQYLPQPLTDEELQEVVIQAIAAAGAASMKDMGRVIKAVMAEVGARAEARKVSELVKSRLAQPGSET